MRLTIFLSVVSACHGYIFPAGQPDGVYRVRIDGDGNALGEPTLLERLTGVDTSYYINRRQAPRLPGPSTSCHNRSLNRKDYDSAFRVFNTICDRGEHYAANTSMVVSAGTAIAYLCNYDAENRCWSSESSEADGLMNSSCGNNGIGWVYIGQYRKSYGRENVGINIC